MTTPLSWLRSTVEAADPGPWAVVRRALWGHVIADFKGCHLTQVTEKSADSEVLAAEQAPPNALSIVTLHNLAPELLAVVEAAQADREAHRAFQAAVNESQSAEGLREAVAHMEREEALDTALAALDVRVEEERA